MTKQLECPEITSDIMLGGFFSLFIAYMVNVAQIKISLHAIGMGALISLAVFSITVSIKAIAPVLMLVIFIAGLVGTARLVLQEHQPNELLMGYMLGFIGQTFAFLI